MNTISLKSGLVGVALLAGALTASALDTVLVTANTDVPQEAVSITTLKEMYTGRTMYWPDGQKVVIAVLAGDTDEGLREVCGMGSSQFKTFWRRMEFSGRGDEPRTADNADALVALVASTKGAIALVPVGTDLKGVKVIKVTGETPVLADPGKGKTSRVTNSERYARAPMRFSTWFTHD